MMKKTLKRLINRETLSYLFFGVLTTLVNLLSYKACTMVGADYRLATIIAWILSVTFAYVTNKLYVFQSKSLQFHHLIKELSSFVLSRLFSGACDLAFMILAVEWFAMNDFLAKIFTNVFVVILNYISSKLFVFKKKEREHSYDVQ